MLAASVFTVSDELTRSRPSDEALRLSDWLSSEKKLPKDAERSDYLYRSYTLSILCHCK